MGIIYFQGPKMGRSVFRVLAVFASLAACFLTRPSWSQTTTPTCGTYQNSISFDNSTSFTTNGALAATASFAFNPTTGNVSNSILILQVQIEIGRASCSEKVEI